jgi:hypothetical protein
MRAPCGTYYIFLQYFLMVEQLPTHYAMFASFYWWLIFCGFPGVAGLIPVLHPFVIEKQMV